MTLVLDCSATLSFLMPDETTDQAQTLLSHVATQGAFVPSIWHLEVANALSVAARRGRIPLGYRNAVLTRLARLGITADPETPAAWSGCLAFMDRFNLTAYDAAYLELAQRKNLPLATLDKDLHRAALAQGVRIFAA